MLTVKKSLLFFIIAAVFVVSAAHLSFISAGENGEVDVTFGEFQGPEHEAVLSDPPKTKSIGQRFVNEELNYKIDFWVFSGVALGNVTMVQESEKIYVVTFKAKTTGAARWLRKRKDTYIERLEEVDGGRRFRTLSLEEHSEVGKKKKRKTLTTLDHVKKTMTVEKWKQGKLRKPKSFEIPEGKNYDGPFTAFYNFRYGMYGDIEHDKEYLVKTFPKKQDEEVEISIRLLGVTDSAKRVKKWRQIGRAHV